MFLLFNYDEYLAVYGVWGYYTQSEKSLIQFQRVNKLEYISPLVKDII